MSLYCYTENSQVVDGPRTLPSTWQGISNFNTLSDAQLKTYGWLPYVLVDTGSPGQYYARTLSTFDVQENQVVQTAIYTQWPIEQVKDDKNQWLESQISTYSHNDNALNPKTTEYIRNDVEWVANKQAELARITDWQQAADFDTTKPGVLPLSNSFVGRSYVDQGVDLTAKNQAAIDAGQGAIWDQTELNAFITANRTAADDTSNGTPPQKPGYKIRQPIANNSEQFNRIIIWREPREDANPALRTTYKMQMRNRQDARNLYVFSYTNGTYLTWRLFEDQGNGVWGLEATPAEWQYVPLDMAFIFSYGTNPAVEADYFTDRVEFPAGVTEKNILVAWDQQ